MSYKEFEKQILDNLSVEDMNDWQHTANLFSTIKRHYKKGLTVEQSLKILYFEDFLKLD